MKNMSVKRSLIALTVACGMQIIACEHQSPDIGSALFSVESGEGSVIENTAASQKINEFCSGENFKNYLKIIAGKVDFQAGYLGHFDGSGYSYSIANKTGLDGKEGYFRSDRGTMYSKNGMGMEPPSVNFRHDDFLKSECEVVLASLNGQGGYEQVEARNSVTLSGNAGYGKVDAVDCISVKMLSKSFGTRHTVAFCPNVWFQESITSGSGADSRAQLVMHAN